MKRLRVLLPNLTCASCVSEIEQVMRQQEGVIWATVNFAAGEATIIYDPAVFCTSQLVQAVDRLGYPMMFGDDLARHSQTKQSKPKPLAWMQRLVRALSR